MKLLQLFDKNSKYKFYFLTQKDDIFSMFLFTQVYAVATYRIVLRYSPFSHMPAIVYLFLIWSRMCCRSYYYCCNVYIYSQFPSIHTSQQTEKKDCRRLRRRRQNKRFSQNRMHSHVCSTKKLIPKNTKTARSHTAEWE